MEFGIEKYVMLVMKSRKSHTTEGMELPNQDKIRSLGEKETYKYLGILEASTIKQVEMKEKSKKNSISGERGINSKQKYIAETLSKGKYLGCTPLKIFGTILEVDQRST